MYMNYIVKFYKFKEIILITVNNKRLKDRLIAYENINTLL